MNVDLRFCSSLGFCVGSVDVLDPSQRPLQQSQKMLLRSAKSAADKIDLVTFFLFQWILSISKAIIVMKAIKG